MKLTEVDKKFLAKCPKGWFEIDDLSPFIRNRRYRCQRLEELGYLESKVTGTDIEHLVTKYKVKP